MEAMPAPLRLSLACAMNASLLGKVRALSAAAAAARSWRAYACARVRARARARRT